MEFMLPSSPANPKLRIGLVVDSNLASNYSYEIAQWCQNNNKLQISHLLIQERPSITSRGLLDKLRECSFSCITRMETLLLKRVNIKSDLKYHDLSMLIPETIKLNPVISECGRKHTYAEHELSKVRALQLDVILMFGSGTLQGGILDTAKFGTISPYLCDIDVSRGVPTGFWEVFLKQDYTGFTIRQQSGANASDQDLVKGRITTQYYYSLNKVRIEQICSFYLKSILTDIADYGQTPKHAISMPCSDRTLGMPGFFNQAKYIQNLGFRLINRIIRSKLRMDFKWNVAYQKLDWPNLAMETAIKLPNLKNHFLADPFVITEGGEDYCYVEDYDYSTCRGHIAVYQLHADRAECLGNALVEPFHLSFPFLFRYQSELYMCPETSRNKQIRVYKCVSFPLQWRLHAVLMDGVSAADTMLFERDGRWWMLTNLDVSETGDYCTELSIFWADSPLSSQWTAHKDNPVFIDASKGRNAGLLFDDAHIYRVAQKQGFDHYGKAFSINRIDQLEENAYRETEVRSVQADFFPNISGTHHMHSNGSVTVFDFL